MICKTQRCLVTAALCAFVNLQKVHLGWGGGGPGAGPTTVALCRVVAVMLEACWLCRCGGQETGAQCVTVMWTMTWTSW